MNIHLLVLKDVPLHTVVGFVCDFFFLLALVGGLVLFL